MNVTVNKETWRRLVRGVFFLDNETNLVVDVSLLINRVLDDDVDDEISIEW